MLGCGRKKRTNTEKGAGNSALGRGESFHQISLTLKGKRTHGEKKNRSNGQKSICSLKEKKKRGGKIQKQIRAGKNRTPRGLGGTREKA